MSVIFWKNLRSLRRISRMRWSCSSKYFWPRMEPSFFSRSSSIAKPLIVKDSMMPVAHLRNCTARSEFTL